MKLNNADKFSESDLKLATIICNWISITIKEENIRFSLFKQLELNDYVLDLSRYYMAEGILNDSIVDKLLVS